jgi:methanethiol S-methyltransferase
MPHSTDTCEGEKSVQEHSATRIIRMGLVIAGIHSILASHPFKDGVRKLVGDRYRNGFYRAAYCLQSGVMWGGALIWFLSLPDRVLYRVRAPWSWLMHLGQLVSVIVLWRSVRVVGLVNFLGLTGLIELLRGKTPLPEPEAQGPPLDEHGNLYVAGPFRYTRHSDNLPIFGIVWLLPKMTVNRLTMATLCSIYAIVGSIHSEYRLRRAYGKPYERYQRTVPFMIPQLFPTDKRSRS